MPIENGSNGGSRIQSVETAFNIVESLERTDGTTVSELADRLEMPNSTAHVYLKTLRELGYVTKHDNVYELSLRFLKHGGYARHQLNIYQAAKAQVDELSRATGEVTDLGVEENGRRVLVYKSEGPEGVTQKPVTGEYTHMHMTALGKALLSTFDADRVEEIIDHHGMPQATPETISDPETLFDELEATRERGYSREDEERRQGIRAIGAPIRDEDGVAIGAISISGPKSKLTDERIEEQLVPEIHDAVNIIEIRHKNY